MCGPLYSLDDLGLDVCLFENKLQQNVYYNFFEGGILKGTQDAKYMRMSYVQPIFGLVLLRYMQFYINFCCIVFHVL